MMRSKGLYGQLEKEEFRYYESNDILLIVFSGSKFVCILSNVDEKQIKSYQKKEEKKALITPETINFYETTNIPSGIVQYNWELTSSTQYLNYYIFTRRSMK